MEDENEIKAEEYYAHPEEAKKAQTIVRTGLKARPSSMQFELNREQGVNLIKESPMTRFSFVKHLGEGGYGAVNMIEDSESTERFALKQIRPQKEKEIFAVLNEIYLMQCSDCDNIVKYHETYFYDDSYWIVLELCDFSLTDL